MKNQSILLVAMVSLSLFFTGMGCRPTPDKILKHMDDHAADLKLSAEQQEKYQAFRHEIEAGLKSGFKGHKSFHQEVKTELDKERPDMDAIVKKMEGKIDERTVTVKKSLEGFRDFYAVLNSEQKKEVLEYFRKFVRHTERRFQH